MKKQKGMTLVELVIVVTIIAALAVIALAFYRGQSAKALDAKRKADLARIQVAIEEYEKDYECYPPPQLLACEPGTGLAPYIDKTPCDPATKASYYYDFDTNTCSSWYRLYANLSNDSGTPIGPLGAFDYYVSSSGAPDATLTQIGINKYGCRGGFCVDLLWNSQINGWECVPIFNSPSCNGQCGVPSVECIPQTQ